MEKDRPRAAKTPRTAKATRAITRGLGMAKMTDRIYATMKNLVDIGLLDDATAIVRAIADNKENLVTLIKKGASLADESSQLVDNNKDKLEKIIADSKKTISSAKSSIEPLFANLSIITENLAKNSGKITSLIDKADKLLDDNDKIKELVHDSGKIVKAFGNHAEPLVNNLVELTNNLNSVFPTMEKILKSAAISVPKLENIDRKDLDDFMLKRGIRVFLKAFPRL